jgi:hypothetical protein
MACSCLFEEKVKRDGLVVPDYDRVKQNFAEESREHFEYTWNHLSSNEQMALRLISKGDVDKVTPEDRERLDQKCLLYHSSMFSPIFAEFVARQGLPDGVQRKWFEPPKSSQVDEDNYAVQIKRRETGLVEDYKSRAQIIETQLAELLNLVMRDEFAETYEGDVKKLRQELEDHLITLRTDMGQLVDLEKKSFFPGNPIFEDQQRVLIKDIEATGVALELRINPQLVEIALSLKAKAQGVQNFDEGKKGLLQRTMEAVDKAIGLVAEPLTKAAALITALKTLIMFFQSLS